MLLYLRIGGIMYKTLSNKVIYNDFKEKVLLTDDEIKVLDMLLKRYTIVRIGMELDMSDRNVSRVIKRIKEKYENYKKIEIAKCKIFMS